MCQRNDSRAILKVLHFRRLTVVLELCNYLIIAFIRNRVCGSSYSFFKMRAIELVDVVAER